MKFQSVYPLLYYGKIKLFCTTLRQIQQGVYMPVELFFACCDVVHPLHKLVGPIMHIISMKFQSVYPLLYYGKIKLFCTGFRQIWQGVYKPVELFFACCDVVHPLHNLVGPIMHIISMKFQSVYPLLYYGKIKLFCTTFRQIQQGVYMPVELFFACCDVVHPLHKLVGPIMHIISMKFQSVYPLLYYGKIKLFCTGFRQIWQGVYKPVEWFFACCDVVHPLHNLVGPIMHTISMKFQSVYPLLYYGKIKLFCTGLRQIWQCVYKPVEWFFPCCDVVHPLHKLVGPIMHIISMKFQSLPSFVYGKIKLFCTGFRQIWQGVYKPVEWFFACCDVVHPLHKLVGPIMHIISMKFQSVYPLLYYGKIKLFCTGFRQVWQGIYKPVERFFACCDVVHPLHRLVGLIMHIISMKFQSVYPLLYYGKIKLFSTGFRQIWQGVYKPVEWCFACCDAVHPLHKLVGPIMHIISMKFQSVYPLLCNGKIKLFCTGFWQIWQGVYKPVEWFFACCDVVHHQHNLVGPIMHTISMKFQSVYPLLYYGKIKLFCTGLRQIQQGVYMPVELFFACFDVVHPLHKLVGPIMHIISMKFQSVYPLLYYGKIKLFCTTLWQIQKGVYMPVELFFACCDVVHPFNKLVGPIMHIISMKFQSVYPLLYYGKIKHFCTGLRQVQQGFYMPVELFFACCDVVHPLHKLVGPIMHII